MFKILTLLAVLTSCVIPESINTSRDIDQDLSSYVHLAERSLDVYIDYPVRFAGSNNFNETSLGHCRSKNGIPIAVEINTKFWDRLSDAQREMLLIHEIAHCSLDLDHDETELIDLGENFLCPASIMQENMFVGGYGDNCYINNFDYYIDSILEGVK